MSEPLPPPPALGEAEYQMECPLVCPHCKQTIHSVQVVRLLRSRVNFVSSLPRRGHVIVCSLCHAPLAAELGGMA